MTDFFFLSPGFPVYYRSPTVTERANAADMNVVTAGTLSGPPVPDAVYTSYGDELAELLDSPSPRSLEILKLSSMAADDGYTPAIYPPFPLEQDGLYDWMSHDILLQTPEEQENDLLSFVQPPLPATYSSLPTPDSSSPSTPLSSYSHDPEVLDALSLISDSPASHLGQPSHILPQFDSYSPLASPSSYHTSPCTYPFSVSPCDPTHSPLLSSPLPLSTPELPHDTVSTVSDSPLPSSPAATDLIDLTTPKTEGIRDLLCSSNSEEDTLKSSGSSCSKRKSQPEPETQGVSEPKGKRRKLSKTAKKERKREQNKQAALRYRQRKRGESEVIEDKREELEALNSDLKQQVKALSTEISYLKNLWREVQIARAQRSPDSLQ